jgi:hypothetical protein
VNDFPLPSTISVCLSFYNAPNMGGGVFAFFDATYAELSVGLEYYAGWNYLLGIEQSKYSLLNLTFSLFDKYPFLLNGGAKNANGQSMTVFPLLGVEYDATLYGNRQSTLGSEGPVVDMDSPGDMGALWIKAGAGFDLEVGGKYGRIEALLGFRTANKFEQDAGDPLLQLGGTIRVLVGGKF